MHKVTSADGTTIAYDQLGAGAPVIVVGGATCDRAVTRPLAEELAQHYTVINYDRRGRGDSGDTAPYTVAREVEDIAALAAAAADPAPSPSPVALYGHSSGAALALHAAAAGIPLQALVLHEPPYLPDDADLNRHAQEYDTQLQALLREDRREDAVALFLTTLGTPPEQVALLRTEPWYAAMAAIAPTLAYDSAVTGSRDGGTVPVALAALVPVRTLVISGGASPDWMIETNRRLAAALPAGEQLVLAGQEHVVAPELLVPELVRFYQ